MTPNFLIVFLAALVPLVTGFIYYNPKVMGSAWMKEAGLSIDDAKKGNMIRILLTSFAFSIIISFFLMGIVIHQFAIYSILADEPGLKDPDSEISLWLKDFMDQHGRNFRTFKHGAFHGTLAAIFFAWPILGTSAIFEGKSTKYIFIHVLYWMITLGLMGGIIGQWG
jgi:hypothetical protein